MIPETPVKALLELRRSTADLAGALFFGQNAVPDPEFTHTSYPEGQFGTTNQGDVGYDVYTASGIRRSMSSWRLKLPVDLFRFASRGAAYVVPLDVSYDETTGNVVCLAFTDFDGSTAGFELRLLRAELDEEGMASQFASVATVQAWTTNDVAGADIPYTCVAADGGYAWIGKLGESADGQTLKAYNIATGAADTSKDRTLEIAEGTTLRSLDVTDGWEVQVLGVKAVWRALTEAGAYRAAEPEHAYTGEWTIDPKLDVVSIGQGSTGSWGRRHSRARVKALSSGGAAPYLLEIGGNDGTMATVRDVSGVAAHTVSLPAAATLLAGPSGITAEATTHEIVARRQGAQLVPPFITEDADGTTLSVVPGSKELVLALDRRSIPPSLWGHEGQIVLSYETVLYQVVALDVDDEEDEAIARVRVGVA